MNYGKRWQWKCLEVQAEEAAWAERLAKAIDAAQGLDGELGNEDGETEEAASNDLIISP